MFEQLASGAALDSQQWRKTFLLSSFEQNSSNFELTSRDFTNFYVCLGNLSVYEGERAMNNERR